MTVKTLGAYIGGFAAVCSVAVLLQVSNAVPPDSRKVQSAEILITGDAERIGSAVAETAATLKFYFTPRPPLPGTDPSLAYPAGWSISGQKLTVPNGGFTSAWITQMEGWDGDHNGDPLLRSFQDKIDAAGFKGENASPSNPGCDLTYPASASFPCQKVCVGGGNNGLPCVGASVCQGGTCPDVCPAIMGEQGPKCGGTVPRFCDWGWQNTTRSDWVLGADAPNQQIAVDNIVSPDGPVFGGLTFPEVEVFDAGLRYYTGTLVLPVPSCCKGTYKIGHINEETVAQDQAQPANYIPIAELVSGQLECPHDHPGISLLFADPPTGHSLWRVKRNIIRLRFGDVITLPTADDIQIRELSDDPECGAFGPDLDISGAFMFALGGVCVGGNRDGKLCGHDADCTQNRPGDPGVCNVDNKTLTIQEVGSTFQHQHWYGIFSTGWDDVFGWKPGPAIPNVQYLALVGDANDDGRVSSVDAGTVNGNLFCLSDCGDNNRFDMNGDGRVQNNDTGFVNAHVTSIGVPKPCGH